MTPERKQKYLDTFIHRVNGRGPAKENSSGDCFYILGGHPGCAIGCQPEFQTFLSGLHPGVADKDFINIQGSIASLSRTFERFQIIFLGTDTDPAGKNDANGMTFLWFLQKLHDKHANWDGLKLKRGAVESFCLEHDITVPDSDYAE